MQREKQYRTVSFYLPKNEYQFLEEIVEHYSKLIGDSVTLSSVARRIIRDEIKRHKENQAESELIAA